MRALRQHPVVHLELHTGDLAGACAFYAELFGWRSVRVAAGGAAPYLTLELGCKLGGGVVECATARPLWLPYVAVADAAAAAERARSLGARVLLEPCEGPTGWRSAIAVPCGGQVALWQPKG